MEVARALLTRLVHAYSNRSDFIDADRPTWRRRVSTPNARVRVLSRQPTRALSIEGWTSELNDGAARAISFVATAEAATTNGVVNLSSWKFNVLAGDSTLMVPEASWPGPPPSPGPPQCCCTVIQLLNPSADRICGVYAKGDLECASSPYLAAVEICADRDDPSQGVKCVSGTGCQFIKYPKPTPAPLALEWTSVTGDIGEDGVRARFGVYAVSPSSVIDAESASSPGVRIGINVGDRVGYLSICNGSTASLTLPSSPGGGGEHLCVSFVEAEANVFTIDVISPRWEGE